MCKAKDQYAKLYANAQAHIPDDAIQIHYGSVIIYIYIVYAIAIGQYHRSTQRKHV